MDIIPFFNDFLAEIRLTPSQRDDLKRGHKTLRERLLSDEELSKIIVATFLQGSYRRSTAVRPFGNKRADVDVIVVTNLDRTKLSPKEAMDKFIAFVEKFYKGKYRIQGRSIGIELSYVDLDIVITSAPSEVDTSIYKSLSVESSLALDDLSPSWDWRLVKDWTEPDPLKMTNNLKESIKNEAEWKLAPLWIPDRDANRWAETHPLEQIRWTREKNKNTNRHFINIVKAVKWFRLVKLSALDQPKGYPIEHMIGDCCPDGVATVPEGICTSLENIVSKYRFHKLAGTIPSLPDRGVPSHNVWKRITAKQFAEFYDQIAKYAKIAREAINAGTLIKKVEKWQELFGDKFPDAQEEESKNHGSAGGYTERKEISIIGGGRFA